MEDESEYRVLILMGSQSDAATMAHCADTLDKLGILHDDYVASAHRTPDFVRELALTAETLGFNVVIAAAGGAAHLAGKCAGYTLLPVIGVPIESVALKGMDSLLSTVQMPAGVPVATMAIGKPGAINAALCAAAIIGTFNPPVREALRAYRDEQARSLPKHPDYTPTTKP